MSLALIVLCKYSRYTHSNGGVNRMKRQRELYYAENNAPTHRQFKGNYHFTDVYDRQYMIATHDRQVFANTRFKNLNSSDTARSTQSSNNNEPVINNYGYTKLYVKLTEPSSEWFSHKDIGRRIVLHSKNGPKAYTVELKTHEKTSIKRRTGAIYVKGLSKDDVYYNLALTSYYNEDDDIRQYTPPQQQIHIQQYHA